MPSHYSEERERLRDQLLPEIRERRRSRVHRRQRTREWIRGTFQQILAQAVGTLLAALILAVAGDTTGLVDLNAKLYVAITVAVVLLLLALLWLGSGEPLSAAEEADRMASRLVAMEVQADVMARRLPDDERDA